MLGPQFAPLVRPGFWTEKKILVSDRVYEKYEIATLAQRTKAHVIVLSAGKSRSVAADLAASFAPVRLGRLVS